MDYVETFCRQIRARSAEHRKAVNLLQHKAPSQIVSILRQELDSMIRVIYLLSIPDKNRRIELLKASVEGRNWTKEGSRRRITDRDMLELANKLHGWTEYVYRFGCAFIHLSHFHDYQQRDPMDAIGKSEKEAMLNYIRYYHGGLQVNSPKFSDLIPYLPMVLQKVAGNLESYLEDIEAGKVLDEDED